MEMNLKKNTSYSIIKNETGSTNRDEIVGRDLRVTAIDYGMFEKET